MADCRPARPGRWCALEARRVRLAFGELAKARTVIVTAPGTGGSNPAGFSLRSPAEANDLREGDRPWAT
jgi:hypothetical protein